MRAILIEPAALALTAAVDLGGHDRGCREDSIFCWASTVDWMASPDWQDGRTISLPTMLSRARLPLGFIQTCLPSGATYPPSGPGWLHEIKLDGFRLMAQRRGAGTRLL